MDQSSKRSLAVFISAALILAAAVLAFVFLRSKEIKITTEQKPAALDNSAGLGEQGAQCGGDLHLPCKPGLACVITDKAANSGVCTRTTDQLPGKIEPLDTSAPSSVAPPEPGIVNFRK